MGIGDNVELKVEDIAKTIKKLKREDREQLLLLFSREGKEITKRMREIKSRKVKPLSREELLKGVL